ncbi:MAG: hypothetical protein AAF160_21720 [Pseudomonadota bacterium]
MTKPVDWKNKEQLWMATAAGRRERLRAIVRFMARRAAERTWKAMNAPPVAPPPEKEGRRP